MASWVNPTGYDAHGSAGKYNSRGERTVPGPVILSGFYEERHLRLEARFQQLPCNFTTVA